MKNRTSLKKHKKMPFLKFLQDNNVFSKSEFLQDVYMFPRKHLPTSPKSRKESKIYCTFSSKRKNIYFNFFFYVFCDLLSFSFQDNDEVQ